MYSATASFNLIQIYLESNFEMLASGLRAKYCEILSSIQKLCNLFPKTLLKSGNDPKVAHGNSLTFLGFLYTIDNKNTYCWR